MVWVAQGFGVGRVPVAPGTFGSVMGLGWFAALVCTESLVFYLLGVFAGIVCSVWIGGVAERVLGEKDPGSVVIDEIAAMPICFLGWILKAYGAAGIMPSWRQFFGSDYWVWTLALFGAFRFFDVLKPWPIRRSQALPGGWGITVDDLLAALYVNACFLAVVIAIG